VKRSIEDNLFRIFMGEYDKGNSYAYDLKAIQEHLLWYHQMMDMMADRFPDLVRVVNYEEIIGDPRSVLEKAAALCGLSMSQGTLPTIGDDRGCAKPYAHWIAAALAAE